MLTKILGGVAAVIAVFALFVATRPADFRVERSLAIAAPAATVFELVNTARKWEQWSPWQQMDPAMKLTYEGPEAGVGAVSAWAGNRTVGVGRSTIVESRPNELVRFKLEMIKPMKAVNDVDFTFRAENGQTVATWVISGKNNFIGKAVGLFIDCDKMIGENFEKGLAQLKAAAEAGGTKA